jgi:hypothetical protein
MRKHNKTKNIKKNGKLKEKKFDQLNKKLIE